jgi:hypothetical protein
MAIGTGTPGNKSLLRKFPVGTIFLHTTQYGGKMYMTVHCINNGLIYAKAFNNPEYFNHYSYDKCTSLLRERKLLRILNEDLEPLPIDWNDQEIVNNLRVEESELKNKLNNASKLERPKLLIQLKLIKNKLKQFEKKVINNAKNNYENI